MAVAVAALALSALAMAGLLVAAGSAAGAEQPAPAGRPSFSRGTLDVSIERPTSLAFGPDGRLYVASLTEIHALSIDPATQAVLADESIASGLDSALGIAFDPTAPPSPVVLYASHQDLGATAGFQGTVSTFTGPGWQREDVITGLPTSAPRLNHLTNGLAFDAQGRLYIAQGSATDAGIVDPPGPDLYYPETPLSAAILIADIHDADFDGAIVHSPPGPPMDDSVDQVSGDVAVFAPGPRNAYDLVVHSNGLIYATDNGALGREVSLSCAVEGGDSSVADELNLIEEGNYYGAPNRNRGRTDPRQCTYHAPEEGDGPDFTGPIAVLPNHCSCDGIAEYMSDAFGGSMRGDLIYAEFGRGNISRVILSDDGRSVRARITMEASLDQPLDVTVGGDGTIYIAEFGGDEITYLTPLVPTPTPTATAAPSATPTSTATPDATATHTPRPSPTPTPPARPGDANCDGAVSSIDAALVLQLTAGLVASLRCQEAADVNADGSANSIDAALILQFVAGIIGQLPP